VNVVLRSQIQHIFSARETKHGLSLFDDDELDFVESQILEQDGKFLIKCQIKDKLKAAKPEEIVRQVFIRRLLRQYHYPKNRIEVEKVVYFGSRDSHWADIAVLHEDLQHPYIIFEIKRPRRTDGLEQLKSYCNAEGAPIGVWSNGNEIIQLHREEPNVFVKIPRIPKVTETLRDILTERWNIKWLQENDELKQGKTTLKKIILDLEELVLGNAGVDPFEEVFKLVYSKLYDEWNGINIPGYQLEFFVGDRSGKQISIVLSNLLEGAKRQWGGVFEPTERIELKDDHLKVCVSFLEKIKLFNSNLRVIDEAFEYLIPQVSKKKEGQFFTPRPVEDMVVKMLNPKHNEFVIDPACGSGGFLLHSIMWTAGGTITGKELSPVARNFAQNNVFGIDFAKKVVKIAKAINLIVGDGRSHIYKDNSLAPEAWNDDTKAGLTSRLVRFVDEPDRDIDNSNNYRHLDFDILMTNPPFAGTVKERDILRHYELAERNGKVVEKTERHILFLNRSLQMIRPGGRMAIVLPQGLLNNTNTEYIRRYVIDNAKILAVVGLHGNTFKPHTGTKTSVLILQKYTTEEKEQIQRIGSLYEGKWEQYVTKLRESLWTVRWDTPTSEEPYDQELTDFCDSYFGGSESLSETSEEEDNAEERGRAHKQISVNVITEELNDVQTLIREKEQEFLASIDNTRKKTLNKELRTLRAKLNKLLRKVSEKTSGGQAWLVLSEPKITAEFQRFWLDNRVVQEMDYPIFFAVNQEPLKDNRGEYMYKRQNGEFLLDKNEHPIISHDLDQIAEDFVLFAKQHSYSFWSG
jgi:type I restriction enzyme M protein